MVPTLAADLHPAMTGARISALGHPALIECSRMQLDESVAALCWSRTGASLAAGTHAGTVVVTDTAPHHGSVTGRRHRLDLGHAVATLGWSGDELLAAGADNGQLRVLDTRTGHQRSEQYRGSHTALRWSSDGRHLACAAEADVVVTTDELAVVCEVPFLPGTVNDLCWADGPGALAAAGHGGIRWIDPSGATDEPIAAFYPTWGSVLVLDLAPDGDRLAAGDTCGGLNITDLRTGEMTTLSGYPDRVDLVRWDSTGVAIATAADDEIVLWFCDPGCVNPRHERPECLHRHDAAINDLAFHSVGHLLASADETGRVCVWNPAISGEPAITELGEEVRALAWHPVEPIVAVGTRGGALLVLAYQT